MSRNGARHSGKAALLGPPISTGLERPLWGSDLNCGFVRCGTEPILWIASTCDCSAANAVLEVENRPPDSGCLTFQFTVTCRPRDSLIGSDIDSRLNFGRLRIFDGSSSTAFHRSAGLYAQYVGQQLEARRIFGGFHSAPLNPLATLP